MATVLRDGHLVGTAPLPGTSGEETRLDDGRARARRLLQQARGRRRASACSRSTGSTSHDGVLRPTSLKVNRGEIVGVAGLVGSGKAELGLALGGAVPCHGTVSVAGREVSLGDPRKAIAGGVGFVPDDRKRSALLPNRSVGENFSIAWVRRISRRGLLKLRSERKLVAESISRYRVVTASAAQRRSPPSPAATSRRWCSAVPSSAGSRSSSSPSRPAASTSAPSREIYDLLQTAAEGGAGIVLISSELPELLGIADRIVVFYGGEIKGEFKGRDRCRRKRSRTSRSPAPLRRPPPRPHRKERSEMSGPQTTSDTVAAAPAGGPGSRPSLATTAGGGSRWAATPASWWRWSRVALYLTITQGSFLTWDNMKNIIGANSVILDPRPRRHLGRDHRRHRPLDRLADDRLLDDAGDRLQKRLGAGPRGAAGARLRLRGRPAERRPDRQGKISFLAVTLGALSIWQSFSLVVQEGQTVSVFSIKAFNPIHELVTNSIGPIPLLLIFDVVLIVLFGGLLRYTTFGRSLFAIGSNEEAARLSGINVSRGPDRRLHDRRPRRRPRLHGLGRPPHRRLADPRSEPAADRARRGADRRHQLHRRRRRDLRHRDRRRLPRRRSRTG